VSMDNPDIYGDVFHQLTFKEAIKQKIICDYKIITIAVTEKEAASLIADNPELRVTSGKDSFETDAHNLSVGLTLQKVFEKHGIKHAVTFHSSIKRATFFTQQQQTLLEKKGISNHHISSKQSAGKRASLLRNFANDNKAIISNARCLTEGVDIPSIDCVVFADPKKSTVDIVQAAGRAMRQSKATGKEYGYILLPLIIPEEDDLSDFAEDTNFKDIARVITSLSTQDERIAEQMRARAERKSSVPSDIVQIETDVFDLVNIKSEDLGEVINTRVWSSVGKANWRSFEEARLWTHSQKLSGQKAWFDLMKSEMRPADIPVSPQFTYRRDWVNWGHWLGTNIIATSQRKYKAYEDAKTFVQSLNLENFQEWRRYCAGEFTEKPGLPDDIPANPQRTYKKEWTGWGKFLGTNRLATHLRIYRPFDEARDFVHKLGLKSEKGGRSKDPKDLSWRNYCKGLLEDKLGLKPDNIPNQPFKVYNEWTNWPDWLGTSGKSKDIEYLTYDEARVFALTLNLHSRRIMRTDNNRKNTARNKWYDYCLGLYHDLPQKPPNIPSAIHFIYRDKGFQCYHHFITPPHDNNDRNDSFSVNF